MKNNLIKLLSVFIIIATVFSFGIVYAEDNFEVQAEPTEYSEAYKEWLNLDDEERKNTIEPRKYDIVENTDNTTYLKSMNNIFKAGKLVRASIPTEYDLKDIIPENVKIRDQMQTNSCWAFATIGVLESTLGLSDKNNSRPTVAYDFSERHMNYASTRSAFLNNQINDYGFSRALSDGGNFWMASAYLTNGLGAVDESSLPFENNEDNIDISQIQNKEVTTTLYDTKEFPSVTADQRDQVMQSMKEHIVNYGGIYVNVHGAELMGDGYNNKTGAMYSKDSESDPIDHAVTIIGWDDNYSRENFNEKQRPSGNGAWIVKNSWGDSLTLKVMDIKQAIYDNSKDICIQNGWTTPELVPDDQVMANLDRLYGEGKGKIQGEDAIVEIGNNGYMYISYEDCNIYTNMAGIPKVTNSKDYDNIYQNDLLGASINLTVTSAGELSLANVFKRDSSKQEELDKISVLSYQGYEYKVYVNPNGSSKAPSDLVEVKLKDGDTATVEAGYHMLEFADPIRLTGDSFVVVVQIINTQGNKTIALESPVSGTSWQDAIVNEGESYWANEAGFDANYWTDTSTLEGYSGNLCIKAFTNEVEEPEPITLSDIYIEQAPTKTVYVEGENFDKTGMKVIARYSDGSSHEVTNYDVLNGDNLTSGTTSITIRYTEDGIIKTTTQEITVNKKTVALSDIYIEQAPTKTVYQEGENFDKTGMKVIARYSDGSSHEVTNYDVIDGNNLAVGITSITISYTENDVTKTTTQAITVNKKTVVLSDIYIETEPTKKIYEEGENFDSTGMKVIARYSDGSSHKVTNYQIIGGNNLAAGTNSVTISYTENSVTKTATQEITVNKKPVVLTDIYIEQSPTKIVYVEGENFDSTGMKVIARYSDGSSHEVTDYQLIGGNNLAEGTTSVTISYSENGVTKETTQSITVNKEVVEEPVTLSEIYIESEPTKKVYEEGENFDSTGMKVIARYSDGSTHEITDYEIIGGDNLKKNTSSVTIRYTENGVIRSVTQQITVNEKEEPEEPEDPETPREPVPSNFTDAKAKIIESKLYFSSEDLSNSTGEITIKVDGIELGDESNNYKYYYHISGTQGDKDIDDWKEAEITKESDGTYSIIINIKSEDLSNYNELIESDNLYLYIKEIASVDDKEVENVTTLDVDNESEVQCYIDGKYVGGIEDVLNYNKNNGNNNPNNDDKTTAPGILPYTGRTILIIVGILVLITSGVFAYHRYKHIDR